MPGEGPHNSLKKLYTDALSRIEKRERVALSNALISVGGGCYGPDMPRREKTRAFYNTLKEGLNHDYCEAMSCFVRARAEPHAVPNVSGVAGADGPRAEGSQRSRGHAQRIPEAQELL